MLCGGRGIPAHEQARESKRAGEMWEAGYG
jgi:hypothetical protein